MITRNGKYIPLGSYGSGLLGAAVLAMSLAGCAHESKVKQPVGVTTGETHTTSVTTRGPDPIPTQTQRSALSVSDEILRACNIRFGNTEQAPKFDFDSSELVEQDRSALDQIATCVTTGPLKGRSVQLIGRADPRGEDEYNMALGERRATAVVDHLKRLGVGEGQLSVTSRGKLDAAGQDEEGWAKNRRVDIVLR